MSDNLGANELLKLLGRAIELINTENCLFMFDLRNKDWSSKWSSRAVIIVSPTRPLTRFSFVASESGILLLWSKKKSEVSSNVVTTCYPQIHTACRIHSRLNDCICLMGWKTNNNKWIKASIHDVWHVASVQRTRRCCCCGSLLLICISLCKIFGKASASEVWNSRVMHRIFWMHE